MTFSQHLHQHFHQSVQQVHKAEQTLLGNTLAVGLASFISFWRASSESVSTVAVGAALLICLDTIAGVVCAAFFREFRSRKLRERLVAKLLYYTIFVVCSYIIAALIRATWMLSAPWYAIVIIELASLLETLTRLHIKGGKKFGPAEKVLRLVARAMGEAASGKEDSAQALLTDTADRLNKAADKERDGS